MATYVRDATIDTGEDADYTYESVRDLDTCIDGLIRDLNLFHTTTRGDLIAHDGSGVTRVAIGSANQVLATDNVLDLEPTWTGGTTTITSDTTIAAASVLDYDTILLDGSSNSVALTLHATGTRHHYRIQCINLDNPCSVDCDGSETIGGYDDYYFTAVNQVIEIQGRAASNWDILNEYIPLLQDNATHTTSGTDETDMGSVDMKRYSLEPGAVLHIYAAGTSSDVASGNMTVKYYVDWNEITVRPAAAVAGNDWTFEALAVYTATDAVRTIWWYRDETDAYGYDAVTENINGDDATYKLTIEMANGSDSATCEVFVAELLKRG